MRPMRSHAKQLTERGYSERRDGGATFALRLSPGTAVPVHELEKLVDVERTPEVMLAPGRRRRDGRARTSAADQDGDPGPGGVRMLCRAKSPPAVRGERVEDDDPG